MSVGSAFSDSLIDQLNGGGIFYYEMVIASGVMPLAQLTAVLGDKFPIEVTDNLNGSLTVSGFRCIFFCDERDRFRGAKVITEFREATRVELDILMAKYGSRF